MDALIYTAMSGAERALKAQQVHANNLANMDSAGFRADMEISNAVSLQNGSGYDDRHLAQLQANTVSTRGGSVKETGRDLDVAFAGDSYLAVQWQDGESYTRAGALTLGADGALTVNGHPVLGEAGPIVLPVHSKLAIGADGTISLQVPGAGAMQAVDKIKLVRAEGSELRKNEAGLLVTRNGEPLAADATAQVRAGFLEGSNVSAVEEMVATMSLNRTFEIQMKLFKASDSMNEVGNRLLGA
jgi:flagellar basal-body rod protein FlgF